MMMAPLTREMRSRNINQNHIDGAVINALKGGERACLMYQVRPGDPRPTKTSRSSIQPLLTKQVLKPLRTDMEGTMRASQRCGMCDVRQEYRLRQRWSPKNDSDGPCFELETHEESTQELESEPRNTEDTLIGRPMLRHVRPGRKPRDRLLKLAASKPVSEST